MIYVAFVVDVFSRRIVGWKADTTMRTELVLDALEMALWSRGLRGRPVQERLIHHSDRGWAVHLDRVHRATAGGWYRR